MSKQTHTVNSALARFGEVRQAEQLGPGVLLLLLLLVLVLVVVCRHCRHGQRRKRLHTAKPITTSDELERATQVIRNSEKGQEKRVQADYERASHKQEQANIFTVLEQRKPTHGKTARNSIAAQIMGKTTAADSWATSRQIKKANTTNY